VDERLRLYIRNRVVLRAALQKLRSLRSTKSVRIARQRSEEFHMGAGQYRTGSRAEQQFRRRDNRLQQYDSISALRRQPEDNEAAKRDQRNLQEENNGASRTW
jgi:hypothetical protein